VYVARQKAESIFNQPREYINLSSFHYSILFFFFIRMPTTI
jgi:hypothetical protein